MRITPKQWSEEWCVQINTSKTEQPPEPGSIVVMDTTQGKDLVQLGDCIHTFGNIHIYERKKSITPKEDGIFQNNSKLLSKKDYNHLKKVVNKFNEWAGEDMMITRVHLVDSGGVPYVYWRCGNMTEPWYVEHEHVVPWHIDVPKALAREKDFDVDVWVELGKPGLTYTNGRPDVPVVKVEYGTNSVKTHTHLSDTQLHETQWFITHLEDTLVGVEEYLEAKKVVKDLVDV